MKETHYRATARELLKKGLTKTDIVKQLGCDSSYAYKLVNQEAMRSGFTPPTHDRMDRLEERMRRLEKLVAAFVAMKRFGGAGVTQPQPETPEVRLQRLLSERGLQEQMPEEGQ